MTSRCDDVLAALFLGAADATTDRHLAECVVCAAERDRVVSIRALLAGATVPEPRPDLTALVRRRALPLLAANARRATRALVVRAVAVALLALPIVVLVDMRIGALVYGALTAVLPPALGLYVVSSWALMVTALLALTYAAIPIVAERQAAGLVRGAHG